MRRVKLEKLHDWPHSPAQAIAIQRRLSPRVLRSGKVISPRFIAGVDIAAGRPGDMAQAAVVVLSYPELAVVATEIAQGEFNFPYIPGLLSFRESPLVVAALEKLTITPDLILVDGQGIAHPRRMGLACHLGLLLAWPTIGCAKSRLCGHHQPPGETPGSFAQLVDGDETIGAALRTRAGVRPVYVSIGHRIDLENAIYWVLELCRGYRLPEPLRLAHLAAGGSLKQAKSVVAYQSRLLE